jgi:hypothetical protein
VIEHENLSYAWTSAFNEIVGAPAHEIVPLVVCITGFDQGVVHEDQRIRTLLDAALRAEGHQSIRTVASTIFPSSLWNPNNPPQDLFHRYERVLPRLHRCPLNRNGVYFERMIRYQPRNIEAPVNQVEHILTTRAAGNRRRSAYQIAVFDPTRDHTHQRQRGFPCLQQISVSPIGQGELSVNGFYATQTLFERAYGNYVGLCELGRFFAHVWNLSLTRVTCVTSVAQLDFSARDARSLAKRALSLLENAPEDITPTHEG